MRQNNIMYSQANLNNNNWSMSSFERAKQVYVSIISSYLVKCKETGFKWGN